MKKIIIIGAVDSGKTSLLMAIDGQVGKASKTQTLDYKDFMIDTPGEYLESPMFRSILLNVASEASLIMFTQDSTSSKIVFPPKFASTFNCMTIGIITKIDHQKSNIDKSYKILEDLSLKGPIFKISSYTQEGISNLRDFINLYK